MHSEIESLLGTAKIEFIHHKSIDIDSAGSDPAPRACIDFAILHKRRVSVIVEVKRKTTTHAVITAVGQCAFYSHYYGLSKIGSETPFSRAIICVPHPIVACDLQLLLDELGITICNPKELPAIIQSKLAAIPS